MIAHTVFVITMFKVGQIIFLMTALLGYSNACVNFNQRIEGIPLGYSTEGYKFCFALNDMPYSAEVKFFITSRYDGLVNYQIQSKGLNRSGEVTNKSIATESIQSSIKAGAIIINSTKAIQVIVWTKSMDCSSAFLAVPQIQYETKHKYTYTTFGTDASLLTVACEDDTRISYEGLASFGTSMHVFPNLQNSNSAVNISDFTVLKVEATQAIGFMTSRKCSLCNQNCVEHITEQIPPSYTWGYNFFVAPFQNITGYTLKISKKYKESNFTMYCTLNGITMLQTENTKQHFNIDLDVLDNSYCCITSNQPFAVLQYGTIPSRNHNYLISVWIAPISQYLNEHTFTTDIYEEMTQEAHYITVTVLERYFNSSAILLDTNPLESNSSKWFNFSCSSSDDICGYGISIGVNASNHTVKHIDTNASINVIVYGWIDGESYAYPAGFGMNPIGETFYRLEALNDSAVENTKGPLVIRVHRSGDISHATTVQLNIRRTNASGRGNDIKSQMISVSFKPGDTSEDASFFLKDDDVPEPNETFKIEIVSESGINLFMTSTVEVTIIDDDSSSISSKTSEITSTPVFSGSTFKVMSTPMCPAIEQGQSTCLSVSIPVTMLLSSLLTAVITTLVIFLIIWWRKHKKKSSPAIPHEYECSKF